MWSKEMLWGKAIRDLPFDLVIRSRDEIWRAADFWIKEPETLAWIDSFSENTIFWDIGANIGVFSLYNAIREGNRSTLAFEPYRLNFKRLKQNRRINDIRSMLKIYPYAVADFDGKETFYIPFSGVGYSGGQVGQEIGPRGNNFKATESYQVEVRTLNTLAEIFGVPNYIKIDVDGIECKILNGGYGMLSDPLVRGVLIEVNSIDNNIEGYMKGFGFTSANMFNSEKINPGLKKDSHDDVPGQTRRPVKYRQMGNVIYTRG